MKKILLVFINVVLVLIIFFTFDFLEYKQECIERQKGDTSRFYTPLKYFDFFKIPYVGLILPNLTKEYFNFFRNNIANSDSNTKPSVIVFGCSFAYGTGLEDNQTFSYKLSKLTKRNVYSKALQACGIQQMFYFLSDEKFYETISPPPQYIIYVYIPNHLQRLTSNIFPDGLSLNGKPMMYCLKGNILTLERDISLLYKSFLIKKILYLFDKKRNSVNLENNYKKFMLANELFVQSKELIEKHYPNAKFIILKYNVEEDGDEVYEMPFMWDVLEKEGFIIIDSKDLTGRKFHFNSTDTIYDKYHPSEKAWDLLVPKLVEKLDL